MAIRYDPAAAALPAGTVLAHEPGARHYIRHDHMAPGAPGVARAVLLKSLPGEPGVHEALAVMRDATLFAELLNDGKGIDISTRRDLEFAGMKVLP